MTDATFPRSRLFSDLIGKRDDEAQRSVIERYSGCPDFEPIDNLMIGSGAWDRVAVMGVRPELVFAHPDILQAHPGTSLYYRGMTLLSRKRVAQAATSVTDWEKGARSAPIDHRAALKVARLYNTVISLIVEGSADWTLDDGYRNIVATMGIALDGMFRNRVGDMAEALVKNRIVAWLKGKQLICSEKSEQGRYFLARKTLMQYGSEPDIAFVRNGRPVATIEIKGGTDPAGVLERLGAMAKSFAETPPGCVNFLIAGVVTPEMRARINGMGDVKVYLLNDLSQDGERWGDFVNEVFHHAVRAI